MSLLRVERVAHLSLSRVGALPPHLERRNRGQTLPDGVGTDCIRYIRSAILAFMIESTMQDFPLNKRALRQSLNDGEMEVEVLS